MLAKADAIVIGMVMTCASSAAFGASLHIQVMSNGQPVGNAVISLISPSPVPGQPKRAVVDQIGSQFVPRVAVVQVGTAVDFPNSDKTRHQVYSFSTTKRFSLPLYSGTPPAPVVFDQPGVVSLGCNIHDWMQGFIVVVDTPYFGKTDDGGALSLEAPAGQYQLTLWHERLLGAVVQPVDLAATGQSLTLEVNLSAPPPPRGSDRLRALQNKLRGEGKD